MDNLKKRVYACGYIFKKIADIVYYFIVKNFDICKLELKRVYYACVGIYGIFILAAYFIPTSRIVYRFILFLLLINLVLFVAIYFSTKYGQKNQRESYDRTKHRVERMVDLNFFPIEFCNESDKIENLLENIRECMAENFKACALQAKKASSLSDDIETLSEDSCFSISKVISGISEFAAKSLMHARSIDELDNFNQDIVSKFGTIEELNQKTLQNANTLLKCVLNQKNAVEVQNSVMEKNMGMMNDLCETIHELDFKVQNIEKMANSITTIASQTKLIALNASIEAARFTKDNSSFSVIISEIKKLSDLSSSFGIKIIGTINEVKKHASAAVKSVDVFYNSFHEQENALKNTITIYESVNLSANDIFDNIGSSNEAVEKMIDMSKNVAKKTNEILNIARDIAENTEKLSASSESQIASIEMIKSSSTKLAKHIKELNSVLKKIKIK